MWHEEFSSSQQSYKEKNTISQAIPSIKDTELLNER